MVIDSREVGPGDLFVGLPGRALDGGRFAAQALAAGAWGVLVGAGARGRARRGDGAVLAADDPLPRSSGWPRAWRRELGAQVIGVTGSTGKTSTKDILAALLRPQPRGRSPAARTSTPRSGCRSTMLAAPAGTEVLVLEMAMRGAGQIAELAAIAEPDVGVIVNVGRCTSSCSARSRRSPRRRPS